MHWSAEPPWRLSSEWTTGQEESRSGFVSACCSHSNLVCLLVFLLDRSRANTNRSVSRTPTPASQTAEDSAPATWTWPDAAPWLVRHGGEAGTEQEGAVYLGLSSSSYWFYFKEHLKKKTTKRHDHTWCHHCCYRCTHRCHRPEHWIASHTHLRACCWTRKWNVCTWTPHVFNQ